MVTSLKQVTNELLVQIEEMAKCFFDPPNIALALEINKEFMESQIRYENSSIYKAFFKGWLTSEFEHRKSILSLAKSGSSPAQTMVTTMLERAKLKLIDYGT
jgi:hypothetical protein